MRWRPAYVALGSNLATPLSQVTKAAAALASLEGTRCVLRSSPWRSRPMGPQDQPEFVNAVAGLLTRLPARELLGALQSIERNMGKAEPRQRWGPRVIDLDLLALGGDVVDEPGLRLPHPGLPQRNFVLYPLAEIAPDLWIPGAGRVRTLARRVPDDGLARLAAWGPVDD